ncbi:hypothetical protein N7466_002885 [Penicillium verhagenii]|uniref:uncharacterized protein n=1 Tax=Penicillium verhagenii TaxID=1562060 RepID=UPI002544FB4D|nr:uncharacterized protein N7466_002885 [Penicillium verhagenii]KAJ5939751.1 hypothetical protein N7466_002885 [Penicillium verhagenii]
MAPQAPQGSEKGQELYNELLKLQRDTVGLLAEQNESIAEWLIGNDSSDTLSDGGDDGKISGDSEKVSKKVSIKIPNDDDDDDKLLIDIIPWKVAIYPPPGTNLKRLVAWQVERHAQCPCLSKYQEYNDEIADKEHFFSIFNMCTAKELSNGKPYKEGNMKHECGLGYEVDEEYYYGQSGRLPWGVPAADLLAAITSKCDHPENWMLLDSPRELLIAIEGRYKSDYFKAKPWDIDNMQKVESAKWNRAFEVCGGGESNMCLRCQRKKNEKLQTKIA